MCFLCSHNLVFNVKFKLFSENTKLFGWFHLHLLDTKRRVLWASILQNWDTQRVQCLMGDFSTKKCAEERCDAYWKDTRITGQLFAQSGYMEELFYVQLNMSYWVADPVYIHIYGKNMYQKQKIVAPSIYKMGKFS